MKTECDYCGKKREQAYAESDSEWELPGHPDHIFRSVCKECAPDVDARYACASVVFDAMEQALRDKGASPSDASSARRVAFRSLHVDLDIKSFVKLARKLKVKHPWLKGKKAK